MALSRLSGSRLADGEPIKVIPCFESREQEINLYA
jgi:hypothetical protein